jgi:formylglycine-generating enzyme required for sulfatase activity
LLTRQEQGLAGLAADDWWMETFVQLAGLVDDADRLARDVVRVNPWLAWWCVEEGRGVAEETREAVADRSVRLLESEQVADRRRAVAALAQLRTERTVQPLFRAASDPDEEVAGLAVQTLMEMGESVRAEAMTLAQQPEHSLHQSGLAYLEALMGQPMVWVPPGPFLMGSDKERDILAYDRELRQHEVTLPGYWIGRYPVTVAQFRAFAEPSGYEPRDSASLKGTDDHPMVNVTWHDGLTFCRWLSGRTGLAVTPPSEAEWEKAARGTDGRVYPWGNEFDKNKCNMLGSSRGGTTPVGKYSPAGDSPYGCADMAGNVWEWTRSLWGKEWDKPDFGYPYNPNDGRENLNAGDDTLRVLRGGAFNSDQRNVRCAVRYGYNPSYCYYDVGFRLVLVSPSTLDSEPSEP